MIFKIEILGVILFEIKGRKPEQTEVDGDHNGYYHWSIFGISISFAFDITIFICLLFSMDHTPSYRIFISKIETSKNRRGYIIVICINSGDRNRHLLFGEYTDKANRFIDQEYSGVSDNSGR
jgi:hypothetical protein